MRKKTNWPKALIVAIGIILGVEMLQERWDPFFVMRQEATTEAIADGLDGLRVYFKARHAQNSTARYDVIVLGDSYMMSGVNPDLLESLLEKAVFNYATFGDQGVLGAHLMFNIYKNFHSPPELIVMGFHPETLGRETVSPSILFDLKSHNGWLLIQEFSLKEGLKFWIPSLKHQAFFRQWRKQGRKPDTLSAEEIRFFEQAVISSLGFYAPHEDWALAEPADESDLNPRYAFAVSSSAWRHLRSILQWARENRVPVVYVAPSLSPDWYRLYQDKGVISGYEGFLSKLQKEFQQTLTIVRPQAELSHMSFYSDRLHLNRLGAPRLTRFLARQIRGRGLLL